MEDIKKYTETEKLDPTLFFGISRMEDIYDRYRGKPDNPHRHEYYTVLLIKLAKGIHTVDFREYALTNRQVYFIAPGQVHQLTEEVRSEGYSVVFSNQFLLENSISPQFIEELNLFNDYLYHPPLEISEDEMMILSGYCEEMLTLVQNPVKYNVQALGAYLKLFFIHCNNLCSLKEPDHADLRVTSELLRSFKSLLNEHYASWHSAADYAGALHITPDHLNRVVKTLVGKTSKEMIQSRIITAAKRLLYFSELTSKEIGYRLGFSEPANFSAFFKNCTGQSPSGFRKSA